MAIENWQDRWSSPTTHAQPEALTHANIFLAIDKGILTSLYLTKSMLADSEVVKYYIEKQSASIYKDIPEELRKDPNILKLAILNWKERLSSLLSYALPEALTNELIDWLISNNIFPETNNLLNNKYYILQVAEKKPDILRRVSSELKKDKEIQLLSLIFNPKFLGIVEFESMQQFLNDYGSKYSIVNCSVKDVLKDSNFIKNILLDVPQVYTLLPGEEQKNKENIQIILESDGTNIIFVPESYVTDDVLSLARNSYSTMFELLDDSSKILDFVDTLRNYEKIFAYALYIFFEFRFFTKLFSFFDTKLIKKMRFQIFS